MKRIKKPTKENVVGTLKSLGKLALKLLIVAIAIWVLITFIFGIFRLSGNNMYPALRDGDLCITYRLEEYYTGDVVAYKVDGKVVIGRIVAKAGDNVDGDKEGLLVNGSRVIEEIFYPTDVTESSLDLPISLVDGEFIILNDYRSNTNDSRTYGVISEGQLEGKVVFIFRRRGF